MPNSSNALAASLMTSRSESLPITIETKGFLPIHCPSQRVLYPSPRPSLSSAPALRCPCGNAHLQIRFWTLLRIHDQQPCANPRRVQLPPTPVHPRCNILHPASKCRRERPSRLLSCQPLPGPSSSFRLRRFRDN